VAATRLPGRDVVHSRLAFFSPSTMSSLKYLSAYSEQTQQQVSQLIAQNKLGEVLLKRYSKPHELRTDRALYQYVQDLKSEFLRNADPINKVEYDSKIHVINHALGLHTSISRVQGGKLKAKMRSGSPRSSRKCRWNSCA
jgi:predicted metal-dependent hydrolase